MKNIILPVFTVLTIFLTLILSSLTFPALAQLPPQGSKPGQASPGMGHVYGKITDSTGKAISGASVLVLQSHSDTLTKKRKELLVKGTSTSANGEFSLEDLPVAGRLTLRISATGYKTFDQSLSFLTGAPAAAATPGQSTAPAGPPSGTMPGAAGTPSFDKDLGNIRLNTDISQLQAVTVTASKPTLRMDIDKKTYNVEKDLVSAGGTALDVMKNVPSVQVDIDGNVTMRNSTPTLYIDGRPTTLTLDQIPAATIESVEVITNPSAKYDASGGTAGILNIVLKKNHKAGYNGNLRAGVDKYGGIDGGGDFNVREGKINLSANVMVHQMRDRTTGSTDRLNLTDTPETRIDQSNQQRDHGAFVFGRLGLDYFITNRTTFSLAGIRVHGQMSPTQTLGIITDSLYSAGTVSNYSQRYSITNREFNASGVQLGFKHLFPKEGEEWTADLNHFSGKNTNNSFYTTDYYSGSAGSAITGNLLQQALGEGSNKFLTIQTDYVKPFNAKTKLETGLRASLQNTTNLSNNYTYTDSTKEYALVPAASTNYKNTNNVYAAYVSFTSGFGNFGYQLGLRAESSDYTGDLISTSTHFSSTYPISFFPSVFLSQKLNNRQEVQFSYTRRINRPNFFQLIPYTDYSDSLNITRGNPALVPEFTNSFEVSYTKQFTGNNTILASVYYKQTTDLITRYLDTAINAVSGKEDLINTYINASSSYTMGAELTSQNTLTRWWDISSNFNLYNSKINTDNISSSASQAALWSWFGKFNSNFKLPAKFKVQLTATYQSTTNLPVSTNNNMGGPPNMQSQSSSQGYILSSWGADLAVSRSFLRNDAATATLSMNDIFRTRRSDQHSESAYFIQDYDRLRDPQMIRFNLTYRFGKVDASLFRRKTKDDSMQNANNF